MPSFDNRSVYSVVQSDTDTDTHRGNPPLEIAATRCEIHPSGALVFYRGDALCHAEAAGAWRTVREIRSPQTPRALPVIPGATPTA